MAAVDPTNPLTRARHAIADIVNEAHPDIECFAYVPETGPNFPVAFTELKPAEYITQRKTRRRRDLALIVLVGHEGSAEDAQQYVDSLLEGANDLATILTNDRQLRGTVIDSNVKSDESLSVQQLAGYGAWGHQWTINIELAK